METQERLYPNAICGPNPDVLDEIQKAENSIAIYKREIHSLEQEISEIVEAGISFKTSGKVEEITSELVDYFNKRHPQCNTLLQDILRLIRIFEDVVESDGYRLLFTTVSGNMCRKFHTDINDLRLLCTYSGEGTLWVTEGEGGYTKDEEPSPDQIQQAKAGDVLILKGALHPEGNPVLHRSPAIEMTGTKRVLLRLDTNNLIQF